VRFVFDTNVVLSAALFEHSVPDQAFRRALGVGEVLLSLATLQELHDVLSRPKFERYVTLEEREEFLATLVNRASLVEIKETIEACRDPKDNKVLEVAVSGQATCIVSGDEDLRVLHPFRGIPILTPAEFLAAY
jgi:putative PIN family toxin of toxin-antitoxin system